MKRILTLTGLAALCSGCLMVPKTSITGTLGGQPFSLASPKDSTLVGLRLEAATNGTMQLRIERLECRMNPDVVSMTGKAQVDLVNAVASGVSAAAAEAAKAAAKP
jgi:curli biogenesis system outer membrane secretion channel CsgG